MKIKGTIFRKRKDIKLYKSYNYTGIYGNQFINCKIYDKVTKKFYSGNLERCGESYQDLKAQEKDYLNSIKKDKK